MPRSSLFTAGLALFVVSIFMYIIVGIEEFSLFGIHPFNLGSLYAFALEWVKYILFIVAFALDLMIFAWVKSPKLRASIFLFTLFDVIVIQYSNIFL
jgi:hypothetical protein